jgi:hypothetical protein
MRRRLSLKTALPQFSRYDGRKRNPFDEAECGSHDARAMAIWAAPIALTGFHYSGVTQTIKKKPHKGQWFWSTGMLGEPARSGTDLAGRR